MNRTIHTTEDDIIQIVKYCKIHLDLDSIKLDEAYAYPSLALCVIDAVFSIGVHYNSTRNTIERFRRYANIDRSVFDRSSESPEFSIADLINLYADYSVEFMAKNVYQNLQRTSTRNGILKSEAVLRVARLLSEYGVNYLADAPKVMYKPDFENAFQQIPGQKSGVSLRYFYMLAGSQSDIKPDRMVIRFIQDALNRPVQVDECQPLLVRTCQTLIHEYPVLQPRSLDNAIWQFQRQRKPTSR